MFETANKQQWSVMFHLICVAKICLHNEPFRHTKCHVILLLFYCGEQTWIFSTTKSNWIKSSAREQTDILFRLPSKLWKKNEEKSLIINCAKMCVDRIKLSAIHFSIAMCKREREREIYSSWWNSVLTRRTIDLRANNWRSSKRGREREREREKVFFCCSFEQNEIPRKFVLCKLGCRLFVNECLADG